ncbi:Alpha/Beta hydrolase protein [Mycena albidolilacea]|uniref:Alpha/Beta hydrolase protein n=1 Tax=Mycena albidolilacea TaxID=1033008 RepID=A0AAD7EPG6_9AGAR|nr:Alpha/Beta hydrolase protein [Mycena albidolilacea]
MLRISLETATGSENFAYTIATPTETSATEIVQGLPTVLLLHPVYIGSAIFHPIYADTRLRRFNLVAMDLRGHGWTTAKVEDTYGSEVAARDILKLMEALQISACHLVGLSMGASAALEMAIAVPEKVLSLFLISLPPLNEPVECIEGRQEIANYVKQAGQDANNVDHAIMSDALTGGLQFAYSNHKLDTALMKALCVVGLAAAERNWTGENVEAMHTISVKCYLNQPQRTSYESLSAFARIRCPTTLVYGSEDIVYPLSFAEDLLSLLRTANVDATLHTLEGAPHFANITHQNETHTLLYDFILANSSAADIPPAPASVQSPFEVELGLCDDTADDSD